MTKKALIYVACSKQSQVIKYQRQREFHILELGKRRHGDTREGWFTQS